MNDNSHRSDLRSQLDALAGHGIRCLKNWRFRLELREAARRAPLWLIAAPLVIVVTHGVSVLAGRPFPVLGLPMMGALSILGSLLYMMARVAWSYLQFRPERAAALALHDRHLETKDRLVIADEFISSDALDADSMEAGFMRAAVNDARETAKTALATPLPPLPVPEWRNPRSSWWGVPGAIALILLAGMINLLDRSRTDAGKPVSVIADANSTNKSSKDSVTNPRRSARPPIAAPEPASAVDKSKSATKPQRRLARKEKNMEGEPGSGGGSHASTSNSGNQSAGLSPSQRTAPKEKPPEARREDPPEEREEPGNKKNNRRKRDKGQLAMETNSGQGKASTSTSSMNQFEAPEEADKSGQPLKGEVEDEESEDEDEQEKSSSVSKPMGNQKDPPVDRNLSTRPPGESDQPQNGRGGPGQIKKTRGVPSMILGIPVPDRVPGTPSPGRSKVSQEFSRPKEESHPSLDAQSQNPRVGAVGHIEQPDLLPWRRELIENYFLSIRQRGDETATPPVANPDR